LARLTRVAERVKVELSGSRDVEVHVPGSSGSTSFVTHLDRPRLEALTQDLVDRTVWSCESVLREAKWTVEDIDLVLVLGGQARMPRIRAQLTEACGKEPIELAGSDVVVAVGAARHAATLAGATPGRRRSRGPSPINEMTTLSLGLESAGGVFTRLIPRGTPLPVTRTQLVSTSTDGQTQIVLHLLQGEREMAADNESVARLQIGPLPARPRGELQLEVDISSDGAGLPTAEVRIVESGEAKQARVRPSAGLAESEIVALTAAHAAGGASAGTVSDGPFSDFASSDVVVVDDERDAGESDATDPGSPGSPGSPGLPHLPL
jgi:molecular chaperone DnaK